MESNGGPGDIKRVSYLVGAGPSHACAKYWGSSHGILMQDLIPEINREVQASLKDKPYAKNVSVQRLVNEVIGDDIDIEQVISFLDDASSLEHRQLAIDLRQSFIAVLRRRLTQLESDVKELPLLYAVMVDMHELVELKEALLAILTLNYDMLLETAIQAILSRPVSYSAMSLEPQEASAVQVLKLHGSIGWSDSWPMTEAREGSPLPMWIPPGIQKAKTRYPFNLVWGRAREFLNCDILRVVGCNLSANDWDLVSLLFTTQQTHSAKGPYDIELIDFPDRAEQVKRMFPYLRIKTLLEIEGVGEQIVAEVTRGEPRRFADFTEGEQGDLIAEASSSLRNPLQSWLRIRAELAATEIDSINTASGVFARILEGPG